MFESQISKLNTVLGDSIYSTSAPLATTLLLQTLHSKGYGAIINGQSSSLNNHLKGALAFGFLDPSKETTIEQIKFISPGISDDAATIQSALLNQLIHDDAYASDLLAKATSAVHDKAEIGDLYAISNVFSNSILEAIKGLDTKISGLADSIDLIRVKV